MEGVYAEDPYEDVHPSLLSQYLGVFGHTVVPLAGQTGAGHPEDEANPSEDEDGFNGEDEDALLEQLENSIAGDVQSNIRHEPIKVARSHNPFDIAEDEATFHNLLQAAQQDTYMPAGYGILPEEWPDVVYPEQENLRIGVRGSQLRVHLPAEVWYRRAVVWAQGLDIMSRMLEN